MPNVDQVVPTRTVLIFAFPGAQIIDIAGPAQVFTTANDEGATPRYDVRLVAVNPGNVVTASGLSLLATEVPSNGEFDTLVVPGGPGVHGLKDDVLTRATLQDLSRRARRVCSVCTGAFLLASTGILDGRTAVTHWRSCERLSKEFPAVKVDPLPLFTNDGSIWTTAGVTAGIDLMLKLVQLDQDSTLAIKVARRLVVYMRRAGGQKQYSEPLSLQTLGSPLYERLSRRIASDPTAPWTVDKMAQVAGQSLRTFHRRFRETTGNSPADAVEKVRCELAYSLLQTTELSLAQIAGRTGLGSQSSFRRAMYRQFGVSPTELRKRFSA